MANSARAIAIGPPARPARRADLDGLRGLAVLALVGFHAFPDVAAGGFVGVDVFLVIAGYLVTRGVLEDLRSGQFRFVDFCSRRILRGFPALLIILCACLALGAAYSLFDEYVRLGKHIMAGGAFVSNFVFWSESRDLDTSGALNPLLHLWPLGLVAQFYLVWPLLLLATFRLGVNSLWVTAILAAASFAANIAWIGPHASAAFYLPPARFWELLLGGALAQLEASRPWLPVPNLRAAVGLTLLAAALILLDRTTTFPGWWALLPTLGAFLVLSAGPASWLNRNVFGDPTAVFFGRIAYPLYLWHWPLLAFARNSEPLLPELAPRLAMLALSVVLAWLTCRIIEKYTAKRPKGPGAHPYRVILTGFAANSAVIAAGFLVYNGQIQFEIQRLSKAVSTFVASNDKWQRELWGGGGRKNNCFLFEGDTPLDYERRGCVTSPNPGAPMVFLIGDSHAAYLAQGLGAYLNSRGIGFGQFTASSCTPFSARDRRPRCPEINHYVEARIGQIKPDVVILHANYTGYEHEPETGEAKPIEAFIAERANDFRQLGAKAAIVVGQMPTWETTLPSLLTERFLRKHLSLPRRLSQGIVPDSLEMDRRFKSMGYGPGVVYFSLKDFLCDGGGCRTIAGDDTATTLLVWDQWHLTPEGARYVTEAKLGPLVLSLLGK